MSEESKDERLFNSQNTFNCKLNDGRVVKVHFPSDEQLSRRKTALVVISKTIGGGASETSTRMKEGMDARILSEILEDGNVNDEAEATQVLEAIDRSRVTDVTNEGSTYRVFMTVAGAKTEHSLGIPKQGEIVAHRRASVRVVNKAYGVQEYVISYGKANDIYEELKQEVVGYAPDSRIPLSHKSAVVDAVLSALERDLASDSGDADF